MCTWIVCRVIYASSPVTSGHVYMYIRIWERVNNGSIREDGASENCSLLSPTFFLVVLSISLSFLTSKEAWRVPNTR